CLVGKNEAGKTSLLEALHKLNPDVADLGEFDLLLEYPRRRRKQYQRRADAEPDDALITRWELEDKDVQALEDKLGPGAVPSRIVEIRKGYYPGRRWAFEGGRPQEDSLPASLQKELDKRLPKFLYFSKCNIMEGRVAIENIIKNQERGKLSGPERVFLALLDMVGTKPAHLTSIENSEELIADLEAASAPITDKIFKYWSQNTSLRVSFQLHPGKPQDPPPFDKGYVFETRVLNTRHNLTLNFDERSTGFVWFFSFLVWFSEIRRAFGDNLVVLLDDPGIGLHARAQMDLLRYISQELEPHYQVIYTTHSPFIVDSNHLDRVRTVEDVVVVGDDGGEEYVGTKVGEKVFSINPDTLIPLRAALAYEITRALGEEKALLVESPVDAMYLNWFSRRLNEKGRVGLDPAWKIVPCGGAEKVGAFLGLFGAGRGNAAVLMNVAGGQKRLEQLRESELMRGCGIFSTDKYVDGDDGGIEDVIGRPAYLALVNISYKLSRKRRLSFTAAAEDTAEKPNRVVGQVEEHFAAQGPDIGTFDRYKPAEFLAENTRKCLRKLPNLSESLDRFERLFADINASRDIWAESKAPDGSKSQPYPIAEMAPAKRPSESVETEKV
ncbi:MAG: AAA family ATPase, partial [Planctomycetota bacterium]